MGAHGSKTVNRTCETSNGKASMASCLSTKVKYNVDETDIEDCQYYEQVQYLSPLMILDDFVLVKLISLLDGPTLLSVMLTCKRLYRLGSDPRHWGTPAFFSKAVYNVRRTLFQSIHPKECVAVEDLVLKAKKVKRMIEILTMDNIVLIWETFGPVVAKLFCMLNSVHWFEDYSYVNTTNILEKRYVRNRSATLKLPSGQLISFKYEQICTGGNEYGVDIYAYSSDSKALFSTQPWRINQIHGQWVEVSNNSLELQPIADAIRKEIIMTQPSLTGEFIKVFVETILPIWCDTDVQTKDIIESQKATESGSFLRTFEYMNKSENIPNMKVLQLIVKDKHKRFWYEYGKRIQCVAQYDSIEYKNLWKASFHSLAYSIKELVTKSCENRISLLDMIKDCTMEANRLVIHYSEYIIRPLVHRLAARIRPFIITDPEAQRILEFCLPKGEVLIVTGMPLQKMSFTFPNGKIIVFDLHSPSAQVVHPVTKLMQKCINLDFKGSHQPEVWDNLVVYFFLKLMKMKYVDTLLFDQFELQFEEELDQKKKKGRKITLHYYFYGLKSGTLENSNQDDD